MSFWSAITGAKAAGPRAGRPAAVRSAAARSATGAGFSLRRLAAAVRASWYEGAREDRTNSGMYPRAMGPNAAHRLDARTLRERARWLVESNPHAEAAIDAIVANVVECGIVPVPTELPQETRDRVRTVWREWGGLTPMQRDKPCDVAGQMTVYELQCLWMREVIVAGGCLKHYVEIDRRGRSGAARIPLAIELLSEERFADEADTAVGVNAKTRRVEQGIEIDPATGRHVAYWMKRGLPADGRDYDSEPLRIPADQCVYAFRRRQAGQLRGITWLAPILTRLGSMGEYVENEMVASTMKSQWGYVQEREADEEQFDDTGFASDYEEYDASGNPVKRLPRGLILDARKGCTIKAVGPNVPQSDTLGWMQWMERTMGFGVGISRLALTRDASDANHSSLRAARQEDQRRYRWCQQFLVNNSLNPDWYELSRAAVRVGMPEFPSPQAFLENPEPLLHITARTPGWASVSPLDDAQANEINIGLGLKSRAEVKAEEGGEKDVTDTFAELETEHDDAEARDIPIMGFAVKAKADADAAKADLAQANPAGGADKPAPKKKRGSR